MAYAPHYYAQWSGGLNGGEVWSSGCRFRHLGEGGLDTAALQAYLVGIKTRVAAQWQVGQGGIAAGATLSSLKLNAIDASGHYADEANTAQISWQPAIDGGHTPTTPSFTSTAISLLTANAHGRAHRGRQYWPNFALAMDGLNPPSVTAVARTDVLQWHRGMVALIEDGAPDGNPDVATTFRAIVASGLDGSVHDVTAYAAGNVLDVQRRRKNALTEVYATLAHA